MPLFKERFNSSLEANAKHVTKFWTKDLFTRDLYTDIYSFEIKPVYKSTVHREILLI
jgi:hypothetical protein